MPRGYPALQTIRFRPFFRQPVSTTFLAAAPVPDTSHSISIPPMTHAIRALAMDAVQKANSGHPGMPMGMAEIALALWHRHLKHNPGNPQWFDRDRFVVSNGHGSMLLYALLHLTGYDLPMKELENFRQLHSKTPGHPEYAITPGVETTTGPLGQGLANAVGMALAESLLAAEFNRDGFPVVDHFTYVFLGDGCLMEGISHEVCSLAGTLKLSKLIALYDDNGISIDGEVKHWFADHTPQRFAAYGWNVIADVDGHDVDAVDRAIQQARKNADAGGGPTLICCKTIIGKGAPTMAGTDKVHGAALGEAEIAATRAALSWPHQPFVIPQEVYEFWDARDQGRADEQAWKDLFAQYAERYPQEAHELERRMRGELPVAWTEAAAGLIAKADEKAESIASRKASQQAIATLSQVLPELLGGSADLTGSNFTDWPGAMPVRVGEAGRHINYGVREFGMSAIMNGITLHGGFIPFGGTFLTFSDYSRNALRMAALMRIRSIFVFTHDSIGLGEDGPTHQSVEHTASLRLIPNMDVWRPCDTVESMVAWAAAVERRDGPSALLFSRQNLPFNARSEAQIAAIRRGGYVLSEAAGGIKKARAVILATGSEVGLAIGAQRALAEAGIAVRVVSLPSTTVFDKQDAAYKASVLPGNLPVVAVEAGVTDFWWKYLRGNGAVVGIDTYGESAPAGVLFKHFGFTVDNVVATVKAVI
jgi:transketolase